MKSLTLFWHFVHLLTRVLNCSMTNWICILLVVHQDQIQIQINLMLWYTLVTQHVLTQTHRSKCYNAQHMIHLMVLKAITNNVMMSLINANPKSKAKKMDQKMEMQLKYRKIYLAHVLQFHLNSNNMNLIKMMNHYKDKFLMHVLNH